MKSRLMQKLTDKINNYNYTRPKYRLDELYIGQIVLLKKRKYFNLLTWDSYYTEIKKFAIFTDVHKDMYKHIKSGQKIESLDSIYAIEGDYAINNIHQFTHAFAIKIRTNNWKASTKLSQKQIEELETQINQELYPNQKENSLFGM